MSTGSRGSPRAAGASASARARLLRRAAAARARPPRRRRRRGCRARPAFVSSATRRPRGSGCVESSTATSSSSSSVSARITPAWWKSASTAVVRAGERGGVRAGRPLPRARAAALHREDRLLARDAPREAAELPRIAERLEVEQDRGRSSGSSSQYSSRSFEETSALLPIETNAGEAEPARGGRLEEREAERAALRREADVPGGERVRREGRVQARAGDDDAEAVRADQARAVRAHAREQLVLALGRPRRPSRRTRRRSRTARASPSRSAASAASSTRSPGTQMTARSTGVGDVRDRRRRRARRRPTRPSG